MEMNLFFNEGDQIDSLKGILISCNTNCLESWDSFRDRMFEIGCLVCVIKGGFLIVSISESKPNVNRIKEIFNNHFETKTHFKIEENFSVDIVSNRTFWRYKIPNLLYNSLFYSLKRKNENIEKIFTKRKKIILFSYDIGCTVQFLSVGNNNFGLILDYFKSGLEKRINPSNLPDTSNRFQLLNDQLELIFQEKPLVFFLGGNKFIIKNKLWSFA